jgi:hypothetical protein
MSQCARFVHNTQCSHEIALEQIRRYLKGTMTKGLVLCPDGTLNIDDYVNANNFAGLWPYEDKQDRVREEDKKVVPRVDLYLLLAIVSCSLRITAILQVLFHICIAATFLT